MSLVDGPVRVRVPATSANLGPGFDALGLALGIHDELAAEIRPDGLAVEVTGEGSSDVARDETHLVVRAARAALERMSAPVPGLALTCRNAIPHARGLGSSAAAIVGGILLARGLVTDGAARLPDADVLRLASELEGHPDNVAACLFGGLTIAWTDDGAHAISRPVHPAVQPVVFVPPFGASTEVARGLIPADVPHGDAALNAGRAALLIAALTATPEVLFEATEDRLHQPYRAGAMPETSALVARLRADGHAAVVSGAGPTVLVLAAGDEGAAKAAAAGPAGWRVERPPIDAAGAGQVAAEE
jgi:homoserine kinase